MHKPNTFFEEQAFQRGYSCIAGIDEVGRGAFAGPVVAAACILPRGMMIEGVDDSKKLRSSQREDLYHIIVKHPDIIFGIGMVNNILIDEMTILAASLYAMKRAVQNLPITPDYLLVDGNHLPTIHIDSQAVVQGDSLSQSIGAASILAKCIRDRIMVKLHKRWPYYGWDRNKGYGTQEHRDALATQPLSPIHRRSFLKKIKCHTFTSNRSTML